MHTVFALTRFVVVIHWLIFPYPSGLLHWHCGNLTIAPVPAKQPWWIWINTSCEFIMNDCITTTKQSTTKPCAYFLGYTISVISAHNKPQQTTTKRAICVQKCITCKSKREFWCCSNNSFINRWSISYVSDKIDPRTFQYIGIRLAIRWMDALF